MREIGLETTLGEKCGERDRVRDLETTLGEKRGRRDRVRESVVREMGLEKAR